MPHSAWIDPPLLPKEGYGLACWRQPHQITHAPRSIDITTQSYPTARIVHEPGHRSPFDIHMLLDAPVATRAGVAASGVPRTEVALRAASGARTPTLQLVLVQQDAMLMNSEHFSERCASDAAHSGERSHLWGPGGGLSERQGQSGDAAGAAATAEGWDGAACAGAGS